MIFEPIRTESRRDITEAVRDGSKSTKRPPPASSPPDAVDATPRHATRRAGTTRCRPSTCRRRTRTTNGGACSSPSTARGRASRPCPASPSPSPVCSSSRRGSRLCGNQIYGAFVLNQRVVLHAIFMISARWRGGSQSHLEGRGDLDAVQIHSKSNIKPPTSS